MSVALVTYKNNSWIREIAENLDEEFEDFDYFKARNGNLDLLNGDNYRGEHYQSTIKFGTYASYTPRSEIEYNKKEGVKLASDKLNARKEMMENLIPTPKTWSRLEIERKIYRENGDDLIYPIIGREANHHGGKGFYSYKNEHELIEGLEKREADYFSEYYPKTKEYRVHIASGRAIIVAEKLVPEENQDEYVWNLGDNGACEDFNTLRWSEYRQEGVEQVIKTASLACYALGLDYGAVDVVAYPKQRKDELSPCAVLEVNTAPRLEEYGIERYTQYFKWLLKHKEERAEYKLPHELDRFSFTNDDFEQEYERLEEENQTNTQGDQLNMSEEVEEDLNRAENHCRNLEDEFFVMDSASALFQEWG